MKFGCYIPQDTSCTIRCIDGVFALVDVRLPGNYTRDGYWQAMLNAKVVSDNQAVLREKVKYCQYATYCRSVAKTLHGVPDDVELYAPGENGEE